MEKNPGPRITIVGVSGSGKTTTALRLSQILNIPHIELDALHWLPNWVMIETGAFRQLVSQALSGPAWVADGNYSKARDLIWPRATSLVWLDYSLPVILWQLARRTLQRCIRQDDLWNGNRETLRGVFFTKDSLFRWAIHSYKHHKQQYPQLLSLPEYAHLQVIHLHSRRETDCWLEQIKSQENS